MTPVYAHEVGRYIALGRRSVPVQEGKSELLVVPVVVEVLLKSGRVASAPAVGFFNRDGQLIIQAKETG